jgi:hypothetical protein
MNFKKLTPKDYTEYKHFFANQKYMHSAYSLSSIIVWRTEFFQPYGAVDGDTFIVGAEFTKHKDRRHLILPVSSCNEYTPEKLCQLAKDTGYEQYFFVTEAYINRYGKDQIKSLFQNYGTNRFQRLRIFDPGSGNARRKQIFQKT